MERDMVKVLVRIPKSMVEGIDELVRVGRFSSRDEAVRYAITLLLYGQSRR